MQQALKHSLQHSIGRLAISAAVALTLSGCAATQVAIAKRQLDVQTKMSATIFLDPVAASKRTVFVQVRNTSDKPEFDVAGDVRQALVGKGYTVVDDPDQAQYLLQANILQVGKLAPTAAEAMFRQGYGGVMGSALHTAGTVAGLGYAMNRGTGRDLAGAGILGGLVDTVASAAVKDVYFSAITDVQIKERAPAGKSAQVQSAQQLQQGTGGTTQVSYSEQSEWRAYQTRILSTANKVNLEFGEAAPELRAGLTRSIAGVF